MIERKEERLLSLDTLRGFDMFFIMGGGSLLLAIANFLPEDCRAIVTEQMGHKAWNGLAFYDIIFPLFLFLAGVSFPFSMAKQLSAQKSKGEITLKILCRGLLLVFLGVLYNGLLQFNFDTLRCASVLGRIGLAWMFASLIYLWLGKKIALLLSANILLIYWALLVLVVAPDAPVGADSLSMEGCIVGYVDRLLLPGQLYLEIHDPEGILSTLPAIVTALIGIFTGEFIRSEWGSGHKKSLVMLLVAFSLLVVGYLWGIFFPINKNLWTSSFVCCAAGWSLLLFAVFYFVIDVLRWKRWTFFFSVIGVNSITIYLAQQFFDFNKPVKTIFGGVLTMLPENLYATGNWLAYIMICWTLLYILYKKKIFLKV